MTVEEYAEEFGETAELIESENEMQVENGCDSMSEDDGGEPGDFQMQDEEEEEEGVALDRKLHDFAPSHGEPVYSIDPHPTDKTLLVTGGGDDWARLLRYEHMTEEFSVVADLGPNTDSIINVKFSVDGKFVATACMDGLVKIYDGVSGAAVQVLEGPNEVVWMDWHPRGHVIAAGAEDGTVWMWNAVSGQCMQVFAGGSMRSTTGCFSPDGKWLVSAGEGIVQVWNPKEGRAELSYDRQQGHPIPEADIISLAVNPASTLIAAGGADGRLVLLSLINWQVRGHLEAHTDAVEGLAFHPNPRLNFLVSAGLDGRLLIWDLNGLQIRAQCKTAEGEEITGVRWLSDPDTFITSAVNGLVSVWDGRSGAKLDQMGLGGVPCLAVAPIPTMNLLFCAYDNGRVVSFAYN